MGAADGAVALQRQLANGDHRLIRLGSKTQPEHRDFGHRKLQRHLHPAGVVSRRQGQLDAGLLLRP